MLTSFPIEQPQPNQEFYGLDVLNLFETYTRAQFEAAGGPLIPFDPTRPEQDLVGRHLRGYIAHPERAL